MCSWRALSSATSLVTLLAALLVVVGCPRPLGAPGAEGPARVAPDAVAVLRLPRLERAAHAGRTYLQATAGGERSELEAMLAFAVGGRAAGTKLLGLADDRALLVSWRPTGEALVYLPVEDRALFDVALDRLLEARGSSRDDDVLGVVRVYREPDGSVGMLARLSADGALLWPAPKDAFAAAALLDALATGKARARWPTGEEPPASDAAAELFADGAGVAALAPAVVASLGGPSAVERVTGRLHADESGLRVVVDVALSDAARAKVASDTRAADEPPPGTCGLAKDAVALVRLPVGLLTSTGDDGPLDDLEGQLALAVLSGEAGEGPGWIALGQPKGLVARDELLASVRAAGVVELRQERHGERTLRMFSVEGAPPADALAVIADDDLFALASDAHDAAARLAQEDAPCQAADVDGPVQLLVKPDELAATLAADPGRGDDGTLALGADPVSALRRLAERLPRGFSRLEASAALDDDGVTVRVAGTFGERGRVR